MNIVDSRMTMKHLKMVYAIAATDSLTKAAEMLNISQPALSNRLQNAEAIAGKQLFLRRGRKLALTAPGQVLLDCAQEVLKTVARAENELASIPEAGDHTLRIGMPPHASYAWIPSAMKELEVNFPGYALEIVSEAADEPWDALRAGAIDMALLSGPKSTARVDTKRFRTERLFRDEFVALLPDHHRLATRPYLDAGDFASETYITNSAVPERNREYALFFQPSGSFPERVVQVGFTGVIPELVAAGVGCTIVTRWIYQLGAPHRGVSSVQITRSGLFLNWFAVIARHQPLSEPVTRLLQIIRESYSAGM